MLLTRAVVTLLLLVSYGHAQNSEHAGYCQSYDYSLSTSIYCSPYVSSAIFIANDTTLLDIDFRLANDTAFRLLMIVQPILPLACYRSTMSLICQSYFPSCTPLATPSYPCKSSCLASVNSCGSIWSVVDEPLPLNCSSNLLGGVWPTSHCTTSVFSEAETTNNSTPLPIRTCPSVYAVRASLQDNEAPCSLRCPDPSYTRDEYIHVAKLTTGVASISVFLQLFLIASYLIDFNKRKFPARLQLFLFISIIGFTMGAMMSGTNPMEDTMCADSTTYSTQSNNSLCATQAVVLMFFAITAHLWILVLSSMTFYTIVFEVRPSHLAYYEKYIHLCVWGIASIFVIITLSTHHFDFGISSRIYCFIKIDLSRQTTFDYYVFYYPMIIVLAVTAILFSASLYKLVKYQRANKKEGHLTETMIIAQRRILVVTGLLIVIFGMSYGFRFSSPRSVLINTLDAKESWINCKVKAELFGLPYPLSCNSDINPLRKRLGSMTFQNVSLSIIGIIVFISFGSEPRIYRHWKTLGKCIKDRDFGKLRGYVVHGYSSDHSNTPPPMPLSRRSRPLRSFSNAVASSVSALFPSTKSLIPDPSLSPSSSALLDHASPPNSPTLVSPPSVTLLSPLSIQASSTLPSRRSSSATPPHASTAALSATSTFAIPEPLSLDQFSTTPSHSATPPISATPLSTNQELLMDAPALPSTQFATTPPSFSTIHVPATPSLSGTPLSTTPPRPATPSLDDPSSNL